MSNPRKKWWIYVKNMIRDYPRLEEKDLLLHTPSLAVNVTGMPSGKGKVSSPVEQIALRELPIDESKELRAVREAIKATKQLEDGQDRITLIKLMYWARTRYTIDGAAMRIPTSYGTARRWHADFIRLTWQCYLKS